MKVDLNYGRTGLAIDLPDSTHVLQTRFVPGLQDEAAAISQALRAPIGSPPLSELVEVGDKVVVVHTDITRATPNDRILPVLLGEIEETGVSAEDIIRKSGAHQSSLPGSRCPHLDWLH
jgi:nickel-dependent lactate racemase